MIHLLKYLDLPWETARGFLREDLDHLEAAINQRWGSTFGDDNQLLTGVIGGDGSIVPRYVANTGVNGAPTWDLIRLAGGVQGRLPYTHLPIASASILVGRQAGSGGDLQEIGLGAGLAMVVNVLTANPDQTVPACRVAMRM